MRARVLTALVVLAVAHAAGAQNTPPVFRSDAYVVAIDYAPAGGAPMLGLTSRDFTVTIDKHIPVAVKVVDDPTRPGFYRITFSPPESLRDAILAAHETGASPLGVGNAAGIFLKEYLVAHEGRGSSPLS